MTYLTESVQLPGLELEGRAKKLPSTPLFRRICSASTPWIFGWNHLKFKRKKKNLIKKVDIWLFIIQFLTLISLEIQIRTLLTFCLIYLTWIRNTFTVWNIIIWTTLYHFYLPISLFLFNWQQEYFFMVHIIKLWLLMHVF